MSIRITLLPILLISMFCAGCTSYNPKAIYDSLQTRDQLQTTPAERAGKPEPLNYQQYESERTRK